MRALLGLLVTLALSAMGTLSMTAWLVGPLGDGPHPADRELIEHLRRNRAAFDELRVAADLATPPGEATYLYGGAASSELETQRRELLTQMRQLHVDVNLVFTDTDPSPGGEAAELKLAMHSQGLLSAGSIKGLLWSPERPSGPMLESLDGDLDALAARGCPEHETCVRHVEGGWYLFVSYDR